MKKIVQFTKIRLLMIVLSLVVIGAGLIVTITKNGFNLGVDFQAGLNLQVEIQSSSTAVSITSLRDVLSTFDGLQVQVIGADELQRFTIRIRDDGSIADFSNQMRDEISATLAATFGTSAVDILGEDYVEPRFAADLALNTTLLIVVAMIAILIYLWIRFRFAYALSSLTALIHDIAVMVFFLGSFQIELTSATIAAVLTIIGYSLNDTIVIFDRIRENEKLITDSPFSHVINISITQSLSRTIITSVTTLIAVTSIFIFTTGAIQDFALTMIVGIFVGTYSSIFIASPVLLALHKKPRPTHKEHKEKVKEESEPVPSAIDSSALKEQIRAQRQRKKKR